MRTRATVLTLAATAFVAARAFAADTTETFDLGASDFELYLGFDGAGLEKYEKTVWAEVLVGFGFVERFSGWVALSAEANERFAAGEGGASFGVFGTPLDTEYLDLDLSLGAGFGGDEVFAAPGLELNLDARPDLALCGLYVRVEEALAGRDETIADDPATTEIDETRERYAFEPTTALTAITSGSRPASSSSCRLRLTFPQRASLWRRASWQGSSRRCSPPPTDPRVALPLAGVRRCTIDAG